MRDVLERGVDPKTGQSDLLASMTLLKRDPFKGCLLVYAVELVGTRLLERKRPPRLAFRQHRERGVCSGQV